MLNTYLQKQRLAELELILKDTFRNSTIFHYKWQLCWHNNVTTSWPWPWLVTQCVHKWLLFISCFFSPGVVGRGLRLLDMAVAHLISFTHQAPALYSTITVHYLDLASSPVLAGLLCPQSTSHPSLLFQPSCSSGFAYMPSNHDLFSVFRNVFCFCGSPACPHRHPDSPLRVSSQSTQGPGSKRIGAGSTLFRTIQSVCCKYKCIFRSMLTNMNIFANSKIREFF